MLHAALLIIGVAMSVPPPKLSEIRVDSLPPLTDAEYIELIGVAGFSLDGFSIVVIGDDDSAIGPELGNSGVLEAVISLDGQVIPADRSFLIHASPASTAASELMLPTHNEPAHGGLTAPAVSTVASAEYANDPMCQASVSRQRLV